MKLRVPGLLAEFISQIPDALVDLILPRYCVLCGPSQVDDGVANLCHACLCQISQASAPNPCHVCAFPIRGLQAGYTRCLGCFRKRAPWVQLAAIGEFDGPLANLIRRLKFDRETSCAPPLGELMAAQAARLNWASVGLDAVIPLPLSSARERVRGFNQSLLIAKPVGAVLALPLRPDWMRRVGAESSQVGRGRSMRLKLGRKAFSVSPQVFGKRLLLVDDVVTTQSTLKAAAGALKSEGALAVYCLVCARTSLVQS